MASVAPQGVAPVGVKTKPAGKSGDQSLILGVELVIHMVLVSVIWIGPATFPSATAPKLMLGGLKKPVAVFAATPIPETFSVRGVATPGTAMETLLVVGM